MRVLAFETSCDDTSVAVVDGTGTVSSLRAAHQDQAHARYGGVVPEIASRNHTQHILQLMDQVIKESGFSLEQIDGIVTTNRPGLMGSLMVGVMTAKTLALALQKPVLGVNHLEGHLLAPFLRDSYYQQIEDFKPQYVALAVSGGHSSIYLIEDFKKYRVLGKTRDDAAGEALDKFAKMAGLGFPGGARVDRAALSGDTTKFVFPRAVLGEDSLDFSFSGLKSAAQRLISSMAPEELATHLNDLCAGFQEAVVQVLLMKLKLAVEKTAVRKVILTGGVSSNSRLRALVTEWGVKEKILVLIPPLRFCTDNAAMIGLVGAWRMSLGEFSDLSLSPSPEVDPTDFM